MPSSQTGGAADATGSGPKRVVASIAGDLPTMHQIASRAFATASVPGNDVVQRFVLANLGVADSTGAVRAQLAEAVPSLANGLWTVAPDGTMETTWTIRPGAQWHDGMPLTANDFLFGLQVVQDPDLAVFRDAAYTGISGAEAPSPDVVTVHWKQPYIYADQLFAVVGWPFPEHLIGDTYTNDKANFLSVPYWNTDYVGTGPYRLKQFDRGSRLVLTANDAYLLGRPKIDEIELRFILDPNVIIANLLSGAVDMSLGRVFAIAKAEELRSEWQAGTVLLGGEFRRVEVEPQFLGASPAIVADPLFRKALMFSMDRQQMADTLQYGLVPVADSMLSPDQPEYAPTLPDVVKYNYDPRKAAQMLDDLGYPAGGDGVRRDAAAQPLSLEIRSTEDCPLCGQTMLAVASYWQQLGITVSPTVVPSAQFRDREYLATFPAFYLRKQATSVAYLTSLLSQNAQLPSNEFVGSNYTRHMDPEFDAAVSRFFSTIDPVQRMAVLRPLVHQVSDQLITMSLFLDTGVAAVSNRVQGPTALNEGWNVQDWDISR